MDQYEEDDIVWLSSQGLLSPSSSTGIGMRKMDRRQFQNSSDESYGSEVPSLLSDPSSNVSASTVSASVSAISRIPEDYVSIPEKLHSVATFVFLGFDNMTARELFQRYSTLLETQKHEDDLLDVANDHVETSGINAHDPSDDWELCLSSLGISQDLSIAIRDPRFAGLQYAESAVWHCKDAFDMRWRGLKFAIESSKRRYELRSAASLRQSRSELPTGSFDHGAGAGQVFRHQTGVQIRNEPGTTTLWKSVGRSRAESMFLRDLPPKHFDLTPLLSNPPGDFNGRRAVYYWGSTLAGARHYVRYQKLKAGETEVCLVSLTIPNHLITSARPYVLQFPSDEWKKTVWCSRRSMPLKGNVDNVGEQELLIGDTSTGKATSFSRIPNWRNVSDNNVIRLADDQKLTQYVFGEEFEAKIQDHCQGKMQLCHRSTLSDIPIPNVKSSEP